MFAFLPLFLEVWLLLAPLLQELIDTVLDLLQLWVWPAWHVIVLCLISTTMGGRLFEHDRASTPRLLSSTFLGLDAFA